MNSRIILAYGICLLNIEMNLCAAGEGRDKIHNPKNSRDAKCTEMDDCKYPSISSMDNFFCSIWNEPTDKNKLVNYKTPSSIKNINQVSRATFGPVSGLDSEDFSVCKPVLDFTQDYVDPQKDNCDYPVTNILEVKITENKDKKLKLIKKSLGEISSGKIQKPCKRNLDKNNCSIEGKYMKNKDTGKEDIGTALNIVEKGLLPPIIDLSGKYPHVKNVKGSHKSENIIPCLPSDLQVKPMTTQKVPDLIHLNNIQYTNSISNENFYLLVMFFSRETIPLELLINPIPLYINGKIINKKKIHKNISEISSVFNFIRGASDILKFTPEFYNYFSIRIDTMQKIKSISNLKRGLFSSISHQAEWAILLASINIFLGPAKHLAWSNWWHSKQNMTEKRQYNLEQLSTVQKIKETVQFLKEHIINYNSMINSYIKQLYQEYCESYNTIPVKTVPKEIELDILNIGIEIRHICNFIGKMSLFDQKEVRTLITHDQSIYFISLTSQYTLNVRSLLHYELLQYINCVIRYTFSNLPTFLNNLLLKIKKLFDNFEQSLLVICEGENEIQAQLEKYRRFYVKYDNLLCHMMDGVALKILNIQLLHKLMK